MRVEPVNRERWMPKTTFSLKGSSRSELQRLNRRQMRRPVEDDAYRANWDAVFVAVCDVCGRRYSKRQGCC